MGAAGTGQPGGQNTCFLDKRSDSESWGTIRRLKIKCLRWDLIQRETGKGREVSEVTGGAAMQQACSSG